MDIPFLAHFLNGLLMVLLPIIVGIVLTRRFQLGWRLWLIGAATFVLSQIAHIPFNRAVLNPLLAGVIGSTLPITGQRLVSALALGLSAGLFEEGARYAMYRWWARDARSWRKGVLAGAGHGGVEALILGGLVLIAFFQMAALRGADLSQIVSAQDLALARQQVAAYWDAPWHAILLGFVERVFSLPSQIALSVLVLQAFTRQRPVWIGVAIAYHMLLDAVTVYAAQTVSPYLTELVIGLLALVSLAIIFALRQPETAEPVWQPTGEPPAKGEPAALDVEVTAENLERSRYL